MGGTVVSNDAQLVTKLKRLLGTGYNVVLLSDDLFDETSAVAKNVSQLCEQGPYPVVPGSVQKTQKKLIFKCGVPFSNQRRISPSKLKKDLSFLRLAVPSEGEPSAG